MSTSKNTLLIIVLAVILVKPVYSQSPVKDTTFHPYHVNYWITGGIIIGGLTLEKIGVPWLSIKSNITIAELQNLKYSS